MDRGILILLALSDCGGTTAGGEPGVGSCQQTTMASGFTFRLCIDYTGLTADQENVLRMVCANHDAGTAVTIGGTYTKSKCDRSGTVGGCRIASGGFTETIWYWISMGPGMDITPYRDSCTTVGGTWIAP